jgi:hypothetical protein
MMVNIRTQKVHPRSTAIFQGSSIAPTLTTRNTLTQINAENGTDRSLGIKQGGSHQFACLLLGTLVPEPSRLGVVGPLRPSHS